MTHVDLNSTRLTLLFYLGSLSEPFGAIFEMFFTDVGLWGLAWEPFGRQDTKRSEKERNITSNRRVLRHPWGPSGALLGTLGCDFALPGRL